MPCVSWHLSGVGNWWRLERNPRQDQGIAHAYEELQTLLDAQSLAIAVLGNGDSGTMRHDEVRPARVAHSRVEYLGHVGVIHHGQGLAFGFEASEDLLRIHAELYHLQRDAPADRLGLLGQIHAGETVFTENVPDGVSPYLLP